MHTDSPRSTLSLFSLRSLCIKNTARYLNIHMSRFKSTWTVSTGVRRATKSELQERCTTSLLAHSFRPVVKKIKWFRQRSRTVHGSSTFTRPARETHRGRKGWTVFVTSVPCNCCMLNLAVCVPLPSNLYPLPAMPINYREMMPNCRNCVCECECVPDRWNSELNAPKITHNSKWDKIAANASECRPRHSHLLLIAPNTHDTHWAQPWI